MSPENQGVFQLLKEVAYRRIVAFFAARENGAVLAASLRGSVRSDWLVGLVQKLLTILCTDNKYMVCHKDCKNCAY